MSDTKLHQKLTAIQTSLVATKDAKVSYGKTNYSYRSCESILEALKPHLKTNNVVLTLSDDVVAVGDRVYIKAMASLSDGETSVSTTAYAREALQKQGMDESQITGSASSYARKYALCGLFAIDDNKDADALHQSSLEQAQSKPKPPPKQPPKPLPPYPQADFDNNKAKWQQAIQAGKTTAENMINKISTQYVLNPQQVKQIRGLAQ